MMIRTLRATIAVIAVGCVVVAVVCCCVLRRNRSLRAGVALLRHNVRAPSDYYFIVLGDWGADARGDPVSIEIQHQVARKMKQFVRDEEATGKRLLFVALTGDNFYDDGLALDTCEETLLSAWSGVYGKVDEGDHPNADIDLTDYPWLVSLGNHDYHNGNAHNQLNAGADTAVPHVRDDAVDANVIVADSSVPTRWGCRPRAVPNAQNYYFPGYNYAYLLKGAVSLEAIFLDTNACYADHREHPNVNARFDEALRFLRQRAEESTAKNVLIIQHFPNCPKINVESLGIFLIEHFRHHAQETSSACAHANVKSVYGHIHSLYCETAYSPSNCAVALSGGGGGGLWQCQAGSQKVPHGFYVVGFDAQGNFRDFVDSRGRDSFSSDRTTALCSFPETPSCVGVAPAIPAARKST